MSSRLLITDGTTTISLLEAPGWLVKDWRPAIAEIKGGGSFRSSPLTDGRRIASRRFDNATETFNMVLKTSGNQDDIIFQMQELLRLLQKATEYWTTDWQNEPVWMEAESPCETETRYAPIVDYRLTGLANPYSQPFYNFQDNVLMDELVLVIERRHWQSTVPGVAGTCVEVSGEVVYDNLGTDIDDGTFVPVVSTDDVTADVDSGIVNTNNIIITIGYAPSDNYVQGAVVFKNVTIPAGSTILEAYITVKASDTLSAKVPAVDIRGQDNSKYPDTTFTGTWADFSAGTRKRLIGHDVRWVPEEFTSGTTYNTPSLVDIVQTLVDQSVWVSGDNIIIFFEEIRNTPTSAYREWWSVDNVGGHNPAQLYIKWATPSSSDISRGVSATCENLVVVVNKHNYAPITDIWYYEAVGAIWAGNFLDEATYPLPVKVDAGNPPGVDDYIYFGSSTAYPNTGPFNNIIAYLSQEWGDVTSVEWSYYNGAWEVLPLGEGSTAEICGDYLFMDPGLAVIPFKQPDDWTTANLFTLFGGGAPAVTAYWVRVKVLDAGTNVLEFSDRYPYTAVLPYVDIDAAQVKGDIPAISRILFDCLNCYNRPTATLSVGLRSLSRGEDFTAFLNCSDEQMNSGITFQIEQQNTAQVATEAPTGKNAAFDGADFTTADVLEEICRWEFSTDVGTQYLGAYHAYVRMRQVSGNEQLIRFQLRAVYGTGYNVSYSEINTNYDATATLITAVDLGQLIVPAPYMMRPGDLVERVSVILYASVSAAEEDFEVYDVVLLPADEWIGTFAGTPEGTQLTLAYDGKRIEIDGITNPRMYRSILGTISSDTAMYIQAELFRIASAHPILQSNSAQRLWFLHTYDTELYTNFEANGTIRVQRSDRYLSFRGDR